MGRRSDCCPSPVKGHGSIVVASGGPTCRSILHSAYSEPPFSIRQCGERILVAASAAAPVGGDALSLDIAVLTGAHANIGTVASTIVLPGPTGAPSRMSTRCTVGVEAHLEWLGKPTVSVIGSDHIITTTVALDESATCRVVEEVSLGRSDELSGRLRLVLRIERGGRPLVHHDETFGPNVAGSGSVVSVGDARHVVSEVLVGVDAGQSRVTMFEGCHVGWLRVADDVVMVLGVGPNRPAVRAAVANIQP
ncbi:MAG: urease accessory protein UreD [Actinomycetota bacterium]|nr:urease accessory protein UreD [Actinomycetota bacterium]